MKKKKEDGNLEVCLKKKTFGRLLLPFAFAYDG